MTTAVDPGYIRWVGVQSPRCPSGRLVRSTLSGTNFVINRSRPSTASDVTTSARHQAERILGRERTDMLDELMFLYGRGVHDSFNFRRSRPNTAVTRSNSTLSRQTVNTPWQNNNCASLQMYRASSSQPRRRMFPRLSATPLVLQNNAATNNVTWDNSNNSGHNHHYVTIAPDWRYHQNNMDQASESTSNR